MFGFAQPELHTPEYDVMGDEVAVFETSKGTVRVRLDGEGAPIHVGNFCELATMGFYDGLKFHRYVPGFVIQGGDPNTRGGKARARRNAWHRRSRLAHQGRICIQSPQQPC